MNGRANRAAFQSTIVAKLLQKILFKEYCFGTIHFVKITKQSLYKPNSFACSLANRDNPVAATLLKMFWWN